MQTSGYDFLTSLYSASTLPAPFISTMSHAAKGYYGSSYDRYMAHNEQSTIHKMKETYWTTKQAVIKKLGKKEDQHIVASDQQLDSKLEVFKAIQKSCMDLLRTLEKYQDRLCALSQEENGMGRFLKTNSQHDKTRAGKMMAAVGKSLSFSSQQRLALRVPLVRLYQEVETFRYRAISDTLMTINRMESARTEYRGALLWMKDVSEQLDPDTHKQLEKFRKVQAQVRKTKARFDRLKLDTMQKIDLLAASRCNMFSHVLANYQTTLLHFWSKTSHTMSAVADSFKGYQYYEFNMLKELCEPAKKLAEETGKQEPAERDLDGQEGEEYTDEEEDDDHRTSSTGHHGSMADTDSLDSRLNSSSQLPPPTTTQNNQEVASQTITDDNQADEQLISFDEEGKEAAKELDADNDAGSMTNLLRSDESTKSDDETKDNDLESRLDEGYDISPTANIKVDMGHLGDTALMDLFSGLNNDLESQMNSLNMQSPNNMQMMPHGMQMMQTGMQMGPVGMQHQPNIMQMNQGSMQMRSDQATMLDYIRQLDEPTQGITANTEPISDPRGSQPDAFIDFGEDDEQSLEEIKRKQNEEFSGQLLRNLEEKKNTRAIKAAAAKAPVPGTLPSKPDVNQKSGEDLLSGDFEADDGDKDDMTLLNEILNAPSTGEDDFTKEWQAVFGNTPLNVGANYTPVEPDQPQTPADFMPSNLLDMTAQLSGLSMNPGGMMGAPMGGGMGRGGPAAGPQKQAPSKANKKGQKTDMSAWFSLFADLDPLANPDAIGKCPEDITDA